MTVLAARAVRGLTQLASRARVLPRPASPAPWKGGGPGVLGGAVGSGSAVLRHGPAVGVADACLRARATFAHWPRRQLSSEATASAETEAPAEEVAPVAQVHCMHAAALLNPPAPPQRRHSPCRRVLVRDVDAPVVVLSSRPRSSWRALLDRRRGGARTGLRSCTSRGSIHKWPSTRVVTCGTLRDIWACARATLSACQRTASFTLC